MTSAHRILFIRTDRLGETLLNLPAMAAFKQAIPHAALTALVRSGLDPLFRGSPVIDQVLGYSEEPSSWIARAVRLRRLLAPFRFDLAVISNPKKELHVGAWLARIPYRVGYDRKWGGLLTHRITDQKALGERHEVDYNLDLLRVLGLPVGAPQWPLPAFEQEQAIVSQLLRELGVKPSDDLIAVHPWASNPQKQWPVNRCVQLISQLLVRWPAQLAVIGGPDERTQASRLELPPERAHNLVGRLTLRQLAAFFTRCRLLISGDSGPVHLAAALGTRTVVLFGSVTPASGPQRWGPWGREHRVIWKSSMEAITVQEALEAAMQVSDEPSGHP